MFLEMEDKRQAVSAKTINCQLGALYVRDYFSESTEEEADRRTLGKQIHAEKNTLRTDVMYSCRKFDASDEAARRLRVIFVLRFSGSDKALVE